MLELKNVKKSYDGTPVLTLSNEGETYIAEYNF